MRSSDCHSLLHDLFGKFVLWSKMSSQHCNANLKPISLNVQDAKFMGISSQRQVIIVLNA